MKNNPKKDAKDSIPQKQVKSLRKFQFFKDYFIVGLGILEEMSLEQLREKLVDLKKIKQIEKEKKRQENSEKKDIMVQNLQEKVKFISERRSEIKLSNEEKRKAKKQFEEEEKKRLTEIREKSLLEVYSKIVDKKDKKRFEAERLAKDLREIKLKRQYMNANQVFIYLHLK